MQPELYDKSINQKLNLLTQGFIEQRYPSYRTRKERLLRLKKMLLEHKGGLMGAMKSDFSSRSEHEMLLTEISSVVHYINYLISHLKKWMRPEKRKLALHLRPGNAKIYYQPLGVIGVMVPFNYPIYLACMPLSTALAAGNRVMIKMPEATPQTSEYFSTLINNTFTGDEVQIVLGEVEISTAFSALPFDHLLFTGSSEVGKSVMAAAAKNLTPVTLELGGKCPVIIDDDACLRTAAASICFGKSLNAGQTCVAPDYVLVCRDKLPTFVYEYQNAYKDFFPYVQENEDVTSIINKEHIERLEELIEDASSKGATIVRLSEEVLPVGSRKFIPALVIGVNDTMKLSHEEIFGPILVIQAVVDLDDAIQHINARPRPLSLYFFGNKTEHQNKVLVSTLSGNAAFNEVVLPIAVDDMPFGGVGNSGMGRYHGKEGFIALSHPRSVLSKPSFNLTKILYPPYGGRLSNLIFKWLLR